MTGVKDRRTDDVTELETRVVTGMTTDDVTRAQREDNILV